MENKKKRGSNYTPMEKETVLELVDKYKDIIENKETRAPVLKQKREAWDEVTRRYNALNSSGVRTWQQLRHLYENIKQRSKKSVSSENRNELYVKVLKIFKATNNKKEIDLLDNSSLRSTLTETNDQLYQTTNPQLEELKKSYSDAALNFVNTENLICEVQPSQDNVTGSSDDEPDQPETTPTVYTNGDSKEKNKSYVNGTTFKEEYYRIKLRNARLENRYLINRHKMEVNKYKLEMEILKLKLKKLRNQRRKI